MKPTNIPKTQKQQQQQRTPASLASDYAERLQRMQERLDKEIARNVVVKDGVKVPVKREKREETVEDKLQKEIEASNLKKNEGIDMDLFPE